MNASDLAYAAARGGTPPTGVSEEVKALWLARSGRWNAAHDLCQDVDTPEAAWVHAHLHRVKGDLDNAGYWYDRAGKTQPDGQAGLGEEWMEITEALLDRQS
ncbi:hypothetical protein HW115_06880 [Verrucomicrobiaceae bacterium N1E253]|uniref:Uncharacterized protein n=1 Tax=Oceaniferula marina TaxID=2748318 RepID=A0A851GC68_9BACT|nr:hypothetical protein [Oceaniferula marina]NWK55328.1 hypothetical protein [Oceaniferula marina]